MKIQATEELLTPKEMAQVLKITPYTLGVWRRERGWIPGIHYETLSKRSFRYYPEAILRQIREDPAAHLKWCRSQLKAHG